MARDAIRETLRRDVIRDRCVPHTPIPATSDTVRFRRCARVFYKRGMLEQAAAPVSHRSSLVIYATVSYDFHPLKRRHVSMRVSWTPERNRSPDREDLRRMRTRYLVEGGAGSCGA